MISLGIDPGLTRTGIAIVRNEIVITYFTKSANKDDLIVGHKCIDLVDRCVEFLIKIQSEMQIVPDVVVLEKPFLRRAGSQNAKVFSTQCRLLQSFYSTLAKIYEPYKIVEAEPAAIKVLFGKAHATKDVMHPKVKKILKFPKSFEKKITSKADREAIIDAAAIAYYGIVKRTIEND